MLTINTNPVVYKLIGQVTESEMKHYRPDLQYPVLTLKLLIGEKIG